jgi:ABC-type branched-subunit amino acid transport system substrate-binding protein
MKKIIIGAVIVVLLIIGVAVLTKKSESPASGKTIKIGLVSPLSGNYAFYGESSRAGAELALNDLTANGIKAQLFVEDGQDTPAIALNAAQKLVNADDVQAIYSDLAPAAISISAFLKDKNILHVYDAAPVSPLADSPLIYKSYLDFVNSCKEVAQQLKNKGIPSVGILEANIEFGSLCTQGIKAIYADNTVYVQKYNLGVTDFRVALLKLSQNNIGAVINVSFPSETIASLKNMRALNMKVPFVANSDSISPDMITNEQQLLEGVVSFGLPPASDAFVQKLKAKFPHVTVSVPAAAALAYIHITQMAHSIKKCDTDTSCLVQQMNGAQEESVLKFLGFVDRIAQFNIKIQEFHNGKWIEYAG